MSRFRVWLRLSGEYAVLEQVARAMAGLPYRLLKQGEVRGDRSRQVQPANVLLLQLARWERGGIYSGDDREAILANERSQLAAATASLLSLAPTVVRAPAIG